MTDPAPHFFHADLRNGINDTTVFTAEGFAKGIAYWFDFDAHGDPGHWGSALATVEQRGGTVVVTTNAGQRLVIHVTDALRDSGIPDALRAVVSRLFLSNRGAGKGPEPSQPAEYDHELKQLLVDWIDKSLSYISEYGGSSDWPPLIADAQRRAEILGIDWTPDEMPGYVKDILAIDDGD